MGVVRNATQSYETSMRLAENAELTAIRRAADNGDILCRVSGFHRAGSASLGFKWQLDRRRCFRMELIALPPNKGMELTIKGITPFARAKAAPLLLAAQPRR